MNNPRLFLRISWSILCFMVALMAIGTIARADVVIDIDKNVQHMTVTVDNVETYVWPISTGISRYDTPSGEFSVTSMHVEWYSKTYDYAPMPHSIFFTHNGHAIHGTTEIAHLGLAASHGCIRLHPDNAKVLYELVSREGMEATKIVVSGNVQIAETPRPRSKAEAAPLQPELPPVVIEEYVIIEPPVIVEEYVVPPRWLHRQWRRERRWRRWNNRRDYRPYNW
jgi:hypothetical protein